MRPHPKSAVALAALALLAEALEYAPLPAEVVSLVQARLGTLKAGGKALATN